MTSPGEPHLHRLSRVYSDETWSLYEELDQSLGPRGPDWLFSKAGEYLREGSVILDAGCRDATHLVQLVKSHAAQGVGLEPVPAHIRKARDTVQASGLSERLHLVEGALEYCPFKENRFDFIWCRDVLEQVESIELSLQEASRVLTPGGRILVYTTVATDLLDAGDVGLLRQHMGNVETNLDQGNIEEAFGKAGLAVLEKHVIGTEWREYTEERTAYVSKALLRLARLRRRRESIVAERGEEVYKHVEANLHWEVFQFLGKLTPIVYLLGHH